MNTPQATSTSLRDPSTPTVVRLVDTAGRDGPATPREVAGLDKTSNIALYVLIAFGLAANWKAVVTSLGSWVILAAVVIVLVYVVLGWAVAFRNQQAAITISMISAMRFTPIGLVVISTVLHNQSAYLTPALLFALVDTFVPLAAGAEIGRFVSRAQPKPAPGARAAAAGAPPAAATSQQAS